MYDFATRLLMFSTKPTGPGVPAIVPAQVRAAAVQQAGDAYVLPGGELPADEHDPPGDAS